MSQKRKSSGTNGRTSATEANGQAGERVQQTLFDKLGESQILMVLQELLVALAGRVEKLEQMLIDFLNRLLGGVPFTEKEFFTPKEFAQVVDRKVETIREHLKEGRIEGIQTRPSRGGIPEWRISHDELKRYQREGLKEPVFRYRHPK